MFGLASAAFGATYTVDRTDDVAGATECTVAVDDCSLRGAIIKANSTDGSDTIMIPAGTYTLAIVGRFEEVAATGDLDVTKPLVISGASAATTIIDANGIDRVLDAYASLTLSNVTLRNGNPFAAGGALISSGTLIMTGVVMRQNTGELFGGALVVDTGSATLTDVTVSDNTCPDAACSGGGIFAGSGSGGLTLNRVTLSDNSSGSGGGAIASEADMTLTNVTISGNTSLKPGAAIKHDVGKAILSAVTIADNTAGGTGGGVVNLAELQARYTIFAHSPATQACVGAAGSTFTSNGHNIDVGTSCGMNGNGDLHDTDPALAPLADNGGPTLTHALVGGSPALDAGGADCPPPSVDQRSQSRPFDADGDTLALCDIGAYELHGPPSTSTTTMTPPSTSTTTSSTSSSIPPTTSSTSSSTSTTTSSTSSSTSPSTLETTSTSTSSSTSSEPTTSSSTSSTSTTTVVESTTSSSSTSSTDTSTTTSQPDETSTTTTTSTSTTTTTLLPCGGLFPVCQGSCPEGEECTAGDLLETCTCVIVPPTTSSSTSSTSTSSSTTTSSSTSTSSTTSSSTSSTSTSSTSFGTTSSTTTSSAPGSTTSTTSTTTSTTSSSSTTSTSTSTTRGSTSTSATSTQPPVTSTSIAAGSTTTTTLPCPQDGFAGLRCTLRGGLEQPDCVGQILPRRIGRRFGQAELLIDKAELANRAAKARRRLRKVARVLERTANGVRAVQGAGNLDGGCASVLETMLADGQRRASELALTLQ